MLQSTLQQQYSPLSSGAAFRSMEDESILKQIILLINKISNTSFALFLQWDPLGQVLL